MRLNLETKTKEQELVKAYLEENASETLAEKINNGTPFEKDGKTLINKKTLDGFMKYASSEARKLASKGVNSACVEDKVVYSWAIHYFEEDSIEGILFNEDGTEYKTTPKTPPAQIRKVEPKKPEQRQATLFDFMEPEKSEPEANDENGDDEFTYDIYLRPWGASWDDLSEDVQPLYYSDWYLSEAQGKALAQWYGVEKGLNP